MSIEPSGIFGQGLLDSRNLMANAAAFQDWTGTANPTQAKEKCFFVKEEGADLPERYVIFLHSAEWLRSLLGTVPASFSSDNYITWQFGATVPSEYEEDDQSALIWMLNQVSAIMEDIEALCGTDDYAYIQEYKMEDEDPHLTEESSTRKEITFRLYIQFEQDDQ